jgi:CRP/FNR family transcriptional regulator, cyclic AMP receptor protein
MSSTEMAGYLAALLVFLTFYMKTMIPLRLVGICSNCIFITYGYLGGLHPVLVLHLILLPLNGLRLREMLRLTRDVRGATQADLNMDWLKPFTSVRRFNRGDVLFRKGDAADAMCFVVSGQGRRRDDRTIMWGTTSTSAQLTGNFAGAPEDTSIGNRRLVRLLAAN